MLKKVISTMLSLCLILCISVAAENIDAVSEATPETTQEAPQGIEQRQGGERVGMPQMGGMEGRIPPNMQKGERPSGNFTPPEGFKRPEGDFTPPQNSGNFTPPDRNFTPSENNNAGENSEMEMPQTENNTTDGNPQKPNGEQQFGGRMPGGMGGFSEDMQNFNGQPQKEAGAGFKGFVKTYSTPITSVILLVFAFVFVAFYRRKNY